MRVRDLKDLFKVHEFSISHLNNSTERQLFGCFCISEQLDQGSNVCIKDWFKQVCFFCAPKERIAISCVQCLCFDTSAPTKATTYLHAITFHYLRQAHPTVSFIRDIHITLKKLFWSTFQTTWVPLKLTSHSWSLHLFIIWATVLSFWGNFSGLFPVFVSGTSLIPIRATLLSRI